MNAWECVLIMFNRFYISHINRGDAVEMSIDMCVYIYMYDMGLYLIETVSANEKKNRPVTDSGWYKRHRKYS